MISDEFKKLGKQTTELDIIEGKDKTEELKELLLRNLKAIIELMDAAEHFINKVDTGKARSKESYGQFRQALSKFGVSDETTNTR